MSINSKQPIGEVFGRMEADESLLESVGKEFGISADGARLGVAVARRAAERLQEDGAREDTAPMLH
jgi:hypothetical protein